MGQDAEDLQADQIDAWLCESIAAVKSGRHEYARDLLIRIVARDERNVQAWLWLSGVVESLEDRKVCLENVLRVDPQNAYARKGLAWVQQQMPQVEEQTTPPSEQVSPFTVSPQAVLTEVDPSPAAVLEPPVVARTRIPVTPAAAMLRKDFASRLSPEPAAASVVVEPASPAVEPGDSATYEPSADAEADLKPALSPLQMQDEFSDEYACPYCAAVTEPDDNRCRLCGKDLWHRFRKQEKRSSLLWILLAFQFGNAMYLFAPVVLLMFIGPSFIGELLGIPEIPPLAMYVLALPSIFSLALGIGLYLRWKPVYYLLFADAGIGLITSLLAFAAGAGFFFGGTNLGLAVVRLVLIFQLGGDFEWDKRRILLRTDRGLKSSVEYLTRADFYNKQKMWALAVVHIRAALGLAPDQLSCHMALVVACIRLKKYELAKRALAEAKRIGPGEPRIAQLEALVNEMRAKTPALP
jgi:tetratricopeptide (TPR) repeat protein